MTKHAIIAVIIIIAIAMTIHFRLLIDRDAIPYADASDALLYSVFVQNFISSSFNAHGELPMWNNYLWSGAPMTGNTQEAVYYPPSWIFMVVPFVIATKLFYIFHTVVAGLLMYFLARELKLGHVPGLVAAMIFMTTGCVYALNVQHFFSNFILWLPGVILFYRMAVRKQNYTYSVIAGIIIAIQFMGSHPQLFYLSMMLFSALCLVDLYRAWRINKGFGRLMSQGSYAVVAVLIAIGFSLFQIIGMLELSSLSTRVNAGGLSFSADISLEPSELLSLFIHPTLGGGGILFIGLLPLFLAQASMFDMKRREIDFFICVAIISLLLSLGKYSPLFYVFHYIVPGFKLFRNPYYGVFFFAFSLTILSAYGAQYLFVELRDALPDRGFIKRLYTKVTISSSALVVLTVVYFAARAPLMSIYAKLGVNGNSHTASGMLGDPHIRTGVHMLVLATVVLIFTFALALLREHENTGRGKVWKCVLIILLAFEVMSASMVSLRTAEAREVLSGNELTEFLSINAEGYRVLNMGGDRILNQTLAAEQHIQLADGYDPMMLNDYQLFMNSAAGIEKPTSSTKLQLTGKDIDEITNWRPLDLLGVKYIHSPKQFNVSRLKLAAKFDDLRMYCHNKGMLSIPEVFVYENPEAMPRVYLTSNVEVISRDQVLAKLSEVESGDLAFVEENSPGGPSCRNCMATIKSYSPNRIEVEADLDGAGLMVLSEVWYPGWRAFVDGEETEVVRTNYLLRGLYLQGGHHNVELIFQPKAYSYGRYVLLLTMAASIALIGWISFLRKAKIEEPAHN